MSTSASNLYNTTGIHLPKDALVVIVRTEWNAASVDKLQEGCISVLVETGLNYKIVTVPGAFEIAFCIRNYWEAYKYRDDKPHAFIALACVVRGDTPHFDYVCRAVTDGVVQLNLSLPAPTIFGVLTVENQQQIDERTGGPHGHKGKEAAITALKMIALKRSFSTPQLGTCTPGNSPKAALKLTSGVKDKKISTIKILFPLGKGHESSPVYTLFCRPALPANGI